MRKESPYYLNIIIPCTIIAVNGLTTYHSVILYGSEFSRKEFLVAYASVCLFYALAVSKSPGYTDGSVQPGGLYVECTKCHLPKPERAHHCRICKRCVLRMDHHCPWTNNCVGYANMPHFVRFLVSAVSSNAYGVWRTAKFLVYIYNHRRWSRRILPNNSRIWSASAGLVGDLIIAMTSSVLLLRVFVDIFQGQTQIENWEKERVSALHRKRLAPKTHFPFDVGFVDNLESAFGSFPLSWVLPWGGPPANGGHVFAKLFKTTERWPPKDSAEVQSHGYYRADRWISFEGENLVDYGVDRADFDVPTGEVLEDDTPSSEYHR